MRTGFGLVRGREHRSRQLLGLSQSFRHVDTADLPGVLVVFPAGADQVPADDGLDWQGLQAFHDKRAVGK